jgi:hypothetical protein
VSGLTNVLIRIGSATDSGASRYTVEAQIDGSGLWTGESEFHFDKLDPGSQSKEEYGRALGRQLLNPSVTRALEQAGIGRGDPVRIRLLVEDKLTAPHWIRWERMYFHIGSADWPVAISPELPFSRYIPSERPDTKPPADNIFRLLFAISNPSDLREDQRLDVEAEIANLLDEFQSTVPTARFRVRVMVGKSELSGDLEDRLKNAGWELADGATSLENVAEWLHRDGGCHALHIICHGNFQVATKTGQLFLENEDGTTAAARDTELQSWIQPKLQLVVFQACRTAALPPEGEPPFVGIAPKMVAFGVPAVVAMQDYVLMSDARAFAAGFYRTLLNDGLVDVAVNAGRKNIPRAVDRVDSTIPALFMRLKSGELWQPDPVRQDVWASMQNLAPQPDQLPLKVVQHVRGLSYEPAQAAEGPRFDLKARLDELVDKSSLTCLTGPPGFDKRAHLELQFQRLAKRYLSGESDTAPLLLDMNELAEWGLFRFGTESTGLRSAMQSIAGRRSVPSELANREFVFLVTASNGRLSEEGERRAVEALVYLLKVFQNSRALVVHDDTALVGLREQLTAERSGEAGTADEVQVLVVQPMEWHELKRHLIDRKEAVLIDMIEERHLAGLASAPWILAKLRGLASRGRFPLNRADALRLIASTYLANFDSRRAPRSCAELALEQIAWRLQFDRVTYIDNDDLVAILENVRDRRDFRLSDLAEALTDCDILARAGEEGVRFGFKALQAYFAARYLQRSARRTWLLEDVTATLGRFSRMRHWEDVLVALAGLQNSTANRVSLLKTIVAGSSLAEGEQVFLAVRMYAEMVEPGRDQNGVVRPVLDAEIGNNEVARQIMDALVWRLRSGTARPYADRRQAAECLAEMRHPAAIKYLIGLAVDPVSVNELPGSVPQLTFERSGIRLIAVNGLFLQYQATQDYVKERRPKLQSVVDAWLAMVDGNLAPITAVLNQNDPVTSPVAAFALGQLGMDRGSPPLLAVFDPNVTMPGGERPNEEVLWAIAEVFGNQDADWLRTNVIEWWLKRSSAPDGRLCYLIQKCGQAPEGSLERKYLSACLKDPEPDVQSRAFRALGKLNDPTVNAWLIPICHLILKDEWKKLLECSATGLEDVPTDDHAWQLQFAALDVLRDVGDQDSMDVMRAFRLRTQPELSQIAFDATEQIYWRLTGGLSNENFETPSNERLARQAPRNLQGRGSQ